MICGIIVTYYDITFANNCHGGFAAENYYCLSVYGT